VLRTPLWLRKAHEFWQHTARPADYPESEADWFRLLSDTIALVGPFDGGLAIGHYSVRRLFGWSTTPLGQLLDAHKHHEDARAGEALAMLLSQFIERAGLTQSYDALLPVPPSFMSRPASPVLNLLTWPRIPLQIPVRPDLLTIHAAISPQKWQTSAFTRFNQTSHSLVAVEAVSGLRVLIVDDLYDTGETVSAVAHALKAQNAAAVGVLAICATGRHLK
jgi:predicted amidophosphoribosyltransferase